ncbi:A/G-specific adenine glycosylase [Brachybacterium aquaticum]|uniref:Adenine DNA glycosylase n=1 Tax=Brachybacterium aquaticum TaxID=1432564 RepID=A0A841AEM7_9MICO|nr:A/G-specific adenine glycosylase [Brachybacterium aquaticum]MBB5831732.1 A/G-specific adenine glycosylase [Brachybacterium aquaticum]
MSDAVASPHHDAGRDREVPARVVVEAAISWFSRARRDLPWREDDASAWSILVSEVMLQQTPVVRVLPRWQEWMERWPTPADLADAATADVLRAWDRLGYPRRALRLQECARAIVAEHGGEVPRGEEALRSLPGIGEYTAAAVTAFAHHGRAVVVDTNIRRVLARARRGRALPDRSYSAAERALATAMLPADREESVAWNQSVMELGALVCTARAPRCEQCPLAEVGCTWYAAGRPAPEEDTRRRQPFEGTDRQLRGRIMALLREHGSAEPEQLAALDPADPARVVRCATSLLSDGLAVRDPQSVTSAQDTARTQDEQDLPALRLP